MVTAGATIHGPVPPGKAHLVCLPVRPWWWRVAGNVGPDPDALRFPQTVDRGLVLQRHLWEVSATSVVGGAGLVLSAPSPVRPGPDVLVRVGVSQDQLHEQAADLG